MRSLQPEALRQAHRQRLAAAAGDQATVRLAADSATGELVILTAQGEVRRSSGNGYWPKVASFEVSGTDPRNDKISYELAALNGRTYIIGGDKHLTCPVQASAGSRC